MTKTFDEHEHHYEQCWICDKLFCNICYVNCPDCGEPNEWGPTLEEEREAAKQNATRIRSGRRYLSRFFVLLCVIAFWTRPALAVFVKGPAAWAQSSAVNSTRFPQVSLNTAGQNVVIMHIVFYDGLGCVTALPPPEPASNLNSTEKWGLLGEVRDKNMEMTMSVWIGAGPDFVFGEDVFRTTRTGSVNDAFFCYSTITVSTWNSTNPGAPGIPQVGQPRIGTAPGVGTVTSIQAGVNPAGALILSFLGTGIGNCLGSCGFAASDGFQLVTDAAGAVGDETSEGQGGAIAYRIDAPAGTNPTWTWTHPNPGAPAVGYAMAMNITLRENFISGSSQPVITADNCDILPVRQAMSYATRGGEVHVPGGTCTWSEPLYWTKPVQLLSPSAGTDGPRATTIRWNNPMAYNSIDTNFNPKYSFPTWQDSMGILFLPFDGSGLVKVDGFQFDGLDTLRIFIFVKGNIPQFVVTHNTFQNGCPGNGGCEAIFGQQQVFGVVGNNIFDRINVPFRTMGYNGLFQWQGRPQADRLLGSSESFFFESNEYKFSSSFTSNARNLGWIESGQGASATMRFNHYDFSNASGDDEYWDSHGFQGWLPYTTTAKPSCCGRGTLGPAVGNTGTQTYEVYYNRIESGHATGLNKHRGSKGAFFFNQFQGITQNSAGMGNQQYPAGCTMAMLGMGGLPQTGPFDFVPEINDTYYFHNIAAPGGDNREMAVGLGGVGPASDVFLDYIDVPFVNGVGPTSPCNILIDGIGSYPRGWWTYQANFDGSGGVGVGTAVPATAFPTCTIGAAYWKTNAGNWRHDSQKPVGGDGEMWKCTSTNHWELYYTPYAYPHPLVTTAGPLSLQITTASPLPTATASSQYTQVLQAIGGTPPYTWAVTGNPLPPFFSLSANGTITGTAPSAGNVNFTARVTDSTSATADKALVLPVVAPPTTLTITSTSPLSPGVVGEAYSSYQFVASGGTPPYQNWVVSQGSLPAGLSLSTAGVLSGTPTSPISPANFTVSVSDSAVPIASVSKAFALTIVPATTTGFTIGHHASAGATASAHPSVTLDTTGASAVVMAVTWYSTPQSGVNGCVHLLTPTDTLNPDSAWRQAGAVGAFQPDALLTRIYVISGALLETGPNVKFTVTPPFQTGGGGIATNMCYAAIAVVALHSTSTAVGNPLVQAVNNNASGSTLLTLQPGPLGGALILSILGTGVGCTTTNCNFAIDSSFDVLETVNESNLSQGLALAARTHVPAGTNLQWSWSTTSPQRQAQGINTAWQEAFFPATTPSVDPIALPNAIVNQSYLQELTATGGAPPYTWSVLSGSLPVGLTLTPQGVIAGTPTAVGGTSFTVQVTDAVAQTASTGLSLTVNPFTAPPLLITTTSPLPPATVGIPYTHTIDATGGVQPYTFTNIGNPLPAGLSLALNGTVSGTPTTATSSASFLVQVADSHTPQGTAQAGFLITVQTPPITLTITSTSPLPQGLVGTPYSYTFGAAGGTSPYTWAVTAGTLPNGFTLSPAGVLTGSPITPTGKPLPRGTASFTVQVTDNASPNVSVSKPFDLTINDLPPLTITTTFLPGGIVGQNYSANLTATGGKAPYTWAMDAESPDPLPAGLTLSSDGTISGTLGESSHNEVAIVVTDSLGRTATGVFFIVVVDAPTTLIIGTPLADGMVGTFYTLTFTAYGGTAPYTWTVTSGGLPAGLTLSPAGVLSGTPTAAGPTNFTLQAADSHTPVANVTSAIYTLNIHGSATSVAITSPAAGAPFFGVIPLIAANVTANGGTVQSVQFKIDGVATGPLLMQPPYQLDHQFIFHLPPGPHTISAQAWNSANISTTATQTFNVIPPGIPNLHITRLTTSVLHGVKTTGHGNVLVTLSY